MYNLIAQQYSKLFPPDKERAGFILEELSETKKTQTRILDAGCANGDLAFELSEAGCSVTGIDLDADMIAEAQKRPKKIGDPHFICRSMTSITDLGSFNLITCFGNTLPHLPSEQDVIKFFKQSFTILEHGGRLVFQIINFDRMEGKKQFEFPEIDTGDSYFKRHYLRRDDGKIEFSIRLVDKKSGSTVSDSTPLLPLSTGIITDMLTKTGFYRISKYTGYDRMPADGTEFATIYTACVQK